jgi:hypothetical protein
MTGGLALSGPTATTSVASPPLTMVGDADAATCTGDSCEIPTHATPLVNDKRQIALVTGVHKGTGFGTAAGSRSRA